MQPEEDRARPSDRDSVPASSRSTRPPDGHVPQGHRASFRRFVLTIIPACLVFLAACGSSETLPQQAPLAAATSAASGSTPAAPSTATAPDWFTIAMTDVRTGQTFSIKDFDGKVVLIETMAEWCPTCLQQQGEVAKLHKLLGGSSDLVSVSLDIDVHEDEASLKEYATALGYDWRFAVAPLEVARALGNLYSAEYLNPPFSPMLLIDRSGAAVSLPYGVKTAEYLRDTLDPYLAE